MRSRRGFLKAMLAAPVVAAAAPAIAKAIMEAPAPVIEHVASLVSTSAPMISSNEIMAAWVDRGPWQFWDTIEVPKKY